MLSQSHPLSMLSSLSCVLWQLSSSCSLERFYFEPYFIPAPRQHMNRSLISRPLSRLISSCRAGSNDFLAVLFAFQSLRELLCDVHDLNMAMKSVSQLLPDWISLPNTVSLLVSNGSSDDFIPILKIELFAPRPCSWIRPE